MDIKDTLVQAAEAADAAYWDRVRLAVEAQDTSLVPTSYSLWGDLFYYFKIKELCPDCHGEGIVYEGDGNYEGAGVHEIDCDHPRAPTLGKLIAMGKELYGSPTWSSAYNPPKPGDKDYDPNVFKAYGDGWLAVVEHLLNVEAQ